MANYEPCSICEEYIEGVICDKDKCPVWKMKKEIERFHKLQNPTETSGFIVEDNKIVFYTNILNGYRHEYATIKEVAEELNGLLHAAYKNDEVLSHYKGKLQTAKTEAIKEFADRLKCNASILCDKVTSLPCSYTISNYDFNRLVKELTGVGE